MACPLPDGDDTWSPSKLGDAGVEARDRERDVGVPALSDTWSASTDAGGGGSGGCTTAGERRVWLALAGLVVEGDSEARCGVPSRRYLDIQRMNNQSRNE